MMTEKVEYKGKVIDSVGNCPHCSSPVRYTGVGPLLDGYVKGLGFKGHKGICVGCYSEFSITEED